MNKSITNCKYFQFNQAYETTDGLLGRMIVQGSIFRTCNYHILSLMSVLIYVEKQYDWMTGRMYRTHSLSSSFKSWKAPLSMVVILFSISCLKEKHQERMRQDETRQKTGKKRGGGRDGRKKE